ncbi:MAG: DUF4302 domain-containing protein [Mediterranea sp.]|jgi:hypothetical protein|nr:DUF4302 domain-containing protein [Mediterranea sp.]
MKKIIAYLLMALPFLVAACTHEEKDLFDESSAIRMEKALGESRRILSGAANGWLMEYYPSNSQAYGGYNIIVSFTTDGQVTVSSESFPSKEQVTSTYSLKQSAGRVLSFDTYNEVMHYYSDPWNPDGIGSIGKGMEGDLEFNIMSATADSVILQGVKTGNRIVMVPMQGDWSEYLTSVQELDSISTYMLLDLLVGTEKIRGVTNYHLITFKYNDEDIKVPYILTPTGYKLYEPLTIAGKTITGFTYDAPTMTFTELTDAAITMVPVFPPNDIFVAGNWFLKVSDSGSWSQTQFNKGKAGSEAEGEEVQIAYFGYGSWLSDTYPASSYGFGFISGSYAGVVGFTAETIGDDKVKLAYNSGRSAGNGTWYYTNADYDEFIKPFIGTFTVSTDDVMNPTYMLLTDDNNPDNWMKLSKSIITYPFN